MTDMATIQQFTSQHGPVPGPCQTLKKIGRRLRQLKQRLSTPNRSFGLLPDHSRPSIEPRLPKERESVLTPCPSSEYLVYQRTAATSSFFRLLPPEIRRHIYLKAFGDSVVHINLFRTSPPWGNRPFRRRPFHSRPLAEFMGWEWVTGVETCASWESVWYGTEDWSPPYDESFGILGWLTSCRQA